MFYIYLKIIVFIVATLILSNDIFLNQKEVDRKVKFQKYLLLTLFIILLIDNILKLF